MLTAPPVIHTPPSSSPPGAPGVIHTPPQINQPPGSAPEVFAPPESGGPVVAATLLVNPTGADNSVLFTAVAAGTSGNAISVGYASPATQSTTTVAVSTNAITVTPGTRARMIVAGAATADVNGTLLRCAANAWSSDGVNDRVAGTRTIIYFEDADDKFKLIRIVSGVVVYSSLQSTASASFPSDNTFSAPTTGSGTPTVTAATSSAAQVIAAVNASSPAASLVTASASGTVTGAVAAVAAANLSGGSRGVTSPPGIFTLPLQGLAGIAVTGTLTKNGSTPLVFPGVIPTDAPSNGRPTYYLEVGDDQFAGAWQTTSNPFTGSGDFTGWFLAEESQAVQWLSAADVATPDLVPAGPWHTTTNPLGWRPVSPATGTPVVALSGGSPMPPVIFTPPG